VHRLGLRPALLLGLAPALLRLLTPALLLLLLWLSEHVALLTRPAATRRLLRLHGSRLYLRHGRSRASRLRGLLLLSHWGPNGGQTDRSWEG
jgi:hypothetical protein